MDVGERGMRAAQIPIKAKAPSSEGAARSFAVAEAP